MSELKPKSSKYNGAVSTIILTAALVTVVGWNFRDLVSDIRSDRGSTILSPTKTATVTNSVTVTKTVTPQATAAARAAQTSTAGIASPTQPPPQIFKVSLSTLCNLPDAEVSICGDDYAHTAQLSTKVFQYVDSAEATTPYWGNLLTVTLATCQAVVISFAEDVRNGKSGSVDTVELLQTSGTPQSASNSWGSSGTLSAHLLKGPITLQAQSSDGEEVYANGYALCSSPSGR